MDINAQYLKYKKKYQRIKSSQRGGDITKENELKMSKEIEKVNDQYNSYFNGSGGYGVEEIKAAQKYEIDQIKKKYSCDDKSNRPQSPSTVTHQSSARVSANSSARVPTNSSAPSSVKSSMNKSDALKEIYLLIKKEVDLDAVSNSPQDAYDKGFISAQLIYLTGTNTVSFENNPDLNAHYVAGFEDGETAGEIKERGSKKYIHIYRDDYVLPEGPTTPQSAIVSQSPPVVLPRVATDRIKAIETKYTGPNGLLGTYGPGTDTLINQMDAEISQVIKEYTK